MADQLDLQRVFRRALRRIGWGGSGPSWRWGWWVVGCCCQQLSGRRRPLNRALGLGRAVPSHQPVRFFAAALVVVAQALAGGSPAAAAPWPVRFGPARRNQSRLIKRKPADRTWSGSAWRAGRLPGPGWQPVCAGLDAGAGFFGAQLAVPWLTSRSSLMGLARSPANENALGAEQHPRCFFCSPDRLCVKASGCCRGVPALLSFCADC